jgi:serine/threonine protein phosphatase PrpC
METPATYIDIFARSVIGQVRDHNEDNLLVGTYLAGQIEWQPASAWSVREEGLLLPGPDTQALMVVADGMGGAEAGEVASQLAVETAQAYFAKLDLSKLAQHDPTERCEHLKKAILQAHQAIVQHAAQDPKTGGMGTTMIAAWLAGNSAAVAWSGDSRCYLFRPGETLLLVSKDHSYVQSLVDQGEITAEQAAFHPQSNVILQSLGDPRQAPRPDAKWVNLLPGDILVLCSDGLNGMVSDVQIGELIAQNQPRLPDTVQSLINAANAAGGHDNISVVAATLAGAEETILVSNHAPLIVDYDDRPKPKRRSLLFGATVLLALLALGFAAWQAGWFSTSYFPADDPNPKSGKVFRNKTGESNYPSSKGDLTDDKLDPERLGDEGKQSNGRVIKKVESSNRSESSNKANGNNGKPTELKDNQMPDQTGPSAINNQGLPIGDIEQKIVDKLEKQKEQPSKEGSEKINNLKKLLEDKTLDPSKKQKVRKVLKEIKNSNSPMSQESRQDYCDLLKKYSVDLAKIDDQLFDDLKKKFSCP